MPLACTSRWRHGPSIRVTDGSGGAIYQPEGSAGVAALRRMQRRCRGLVVTRCQRRPRLLDRFDGLLRAADAPDLEVAEQRQRDGDHHHDPEHDQEGRPSPDPGVEQFGEEEEEKERRVEQHHQRQDEEDAAGQALLDVAGDLGAGQFDLGAHQRRHLRGRVLDQLADRRIGGQRVRVDQRNRGHRAGTPSLRSCSSITCSRTRPPERWVVGRCPVHVAMQPGARRGHRPAQPV